MEAAFTSRTAPTDQAALEAETADTGRADHVRRTVAAIAGGRAGDTNAGTILRRQVAAAFSAANSAILSHDIGGTTKLASFAIRLFSVQDCVDLVELLARKLVDPAGKHRGRVASRAGLRFDDKSFTRGVRGIPDEDCVVVGQSVRLNDVFLKPLRRGLCAALDRRKESH